MHIEVQVALNFVISYLYNKLPRRRVNIFGEELEKALKDKFQGHWYPEKPFKVRLSFIIIIVFHTVLYQYGELDTACVAHTARTDWSIFTSPNNVHKMHSCCV